MANSASSAAAAARSYAEAIYNGTTGIYFTSSAVASLTMNTQVGLKIVGKDNTYFQVMNDAMGFFRSDGTAMLYYYNGNLTLTGIIAALGGYIGGTGGWVIGTNCMYNGNASTLGTSGGIYLGTTGISVGSAITMKPDGTFIIRGDDTSTGDSNYVLKIIPSTNSDGEKVYRLHLGNIIFDDGFVVPPQNGGTGGSDISSAGAIIGLYRAGTVEEMQKIPDTVNGSLCVIYAAGTVGTSISGALYTSPTSSPGYLAMGAYSDTGHRNKNYFDITGIAYWNISNLANESVSSTYARVGVGYTVSGACGLYMPLKITVSGAATSVTSVTVNFNYALRPANCKRDLCTSWDSGIYVSLYKGNSDVKIAQTTYSIPSAWRTASSTVRSASVTLNCSSGISSGEYYVAFYTRSTQSLMWIQHGSIAIEGSGITSADGLYMKSGDMWKEIASSGGSGSSHVLPVASSSALGGVMIGSNISVDSSGKISLTKADVVAALGYTPPSSTSGSDYVLPQATSSVLGGVKIGSNISVSNGVISLTKSNVTSALGYTPPTSAGSTVSISDRLTSGTKIAAITIDGTAYSLYAPTSTSSGGVTGDYVPLGGGAMTGNLTINYGAFPRLILTPDYNSTTNRSMVEGSYSGETSIQAWNDSTGDYRRILAVRNSSCKESIDDAIELRELAGSSWSASRVFHSGMTDAGKKAALESLGISYSSSTPSGGTKCNVYYNNGKIYLVPA